MIAQHIFIDFMSEKHFTVCNSFTTNEMLYDFDLVKS